MSVATVSGINECSTVDFKFESDGDEVIGDLVCLGTLGRFIEARLLAEEFLAKIDYIFPFAVEIMRLLYDQGDLDELNVYTEALMSTSDDRTNHHSWTAKAKCVLGLMHDLCTDQAHGSWTSIDMTHVYSDIQRHEDLDDEQVRYFLSMIKFEC